MLMSCSALPAGKTPSLRTLFKNQRDRLCSCAFASRNSSAPMRASKWKLRHRIECLIYQSDLREWSDVFHYVARKIISMQIMTEKKRQRAEEKLDDDNHQDKASEPAAASGRVFFHHNWMVTHEYWMQDNGHYWIIGEDVEVISTSPLTLFFFFLSLPLFVVTRTHPLDTQRVLLLHSSEFIGKRAWNLVARSSRVLYSSSHRS